MNKKDVKDSHDRPEKLPDPIEILRQEIITRETITTQSAICSEADIRSDIQINEVQELEFGPRVNLLK